MTRINLVDVSLLTDQHLFAEYREITRIFGLVQKSCHNHDTKTILAKIPANYRLGTGHVLFFYDKLAFIENRYFALRDELLGRGFAITLKDDIVDFRKHIDERFYQDFVPSQDDVAISVSRLVQKVQEKPHWYRHHGKALNWQDLPYLAGVMV